MPRNVRPTTVYPIALRELEVVRVIDVTPGMRRVTLTGAQLDAHVTPGGHAHHAFESPGFNDDIRLFFAEPGAPEPVLPTFKDGGISFPKGEKVLAKAYTVRSFNPVARELDINFVKHGIGTATTWAYRARPGDRLHVAGPSCSLGLPAGADWLLVAGDETALPAIARLLGELPDDARAQVFVEIARPAHAQELRALRGVEVTWVAASGDETSALLGAVRAAEWWDGQAFAWVAGEQSVVRDLRHHLVEVRGLDKAWIDFTGYWKRQSVVALDADASVPDPERNEEAFETFHELAELLPPLAIRAAANLGVAEHIDRGSRTVPALAAAVGADERAMGKFLRYLHALELLDRSADGSYWLSPTGEFLTNEHVLDHLHQDGIIARKERAFFGLEQAVRTGAAAYKSVTGRTYAALREDPAFEHALLDDTAEHASFLASPLAEARALASAGHVVVHATGAGAIAAALVAHRPEITVTVPALPTAAAWLRRDLPQSVPDPDHRVRIDVREQSCFERTPDADAVLLVHMLGELPDGEATLILHRAAESLRPGGRVVLLEDTLDEAELDEHAAEEDLLLLALGGGGLRTPSELDALIAAAGLVPVGTETVGWGHTLRVLTRP